MTTKSNSVRLGDYITHITEAAKLCLDYTDGLDKAEFLNDKRTQQAVILNLIVIGEAATKVVTDFTEFASLHPSIPWQQMRGMRNRMAHGYFDINLDIVWDTVKTSLPKLVEDLSALPPIPAGR